MADTAIQSHLVQDGDDAVIPEMGAVHFTLPAGDDILERGAGRDCLLGGGGNILVLDGKEFAGVFAKDEGPDSYAFTSDDGSTSITFENQTSATDSQDFDFGICLVDPPNVPSPPVASQW